MVRQKVTSLSALEQISGVGPARTKKYGAAFLELLKGHGKSPAESVMPDTPGSAPMARK
jgi:hypothetical protein